MQIFHTNLCCIYLQIILTHPFLKMQTLVLVYQAKMMFTNTPIKKTANKMFIGI